MTEIKTLEIPQFSSEDVARIRKSLHMDISLFASCLGVSKKMVESWENGSRRPKGPAARTLQLIEKQPSLVSTWFKFEENSR